MLLQARARLEAAERSFSEWAATHGVGLLRVVLGLIFVWFGVLKMCPGLCDVEVLAGKTVQVLTLGLLPVKVCIWLLAGLEMGIGTLLLSGRGLKLAMICLMLHLCGTFLPMVMFPAETWKHWFVPTLVGQYILKNLVLLCAAVVLAGRVFARGRVLELVPARPRRLARAPATFRIS